MDIWKHGTYVDTWSLVHFLSGFLLAGLFYMFGYGFAVALVCSTALLLLWEVFEWVIKIIEPSMNVVVDIIVGLIGFFTAAYLYYNQSQPFEISFYPALVLALFLALWGFIDFQKRGYR